MNKKMLIVGLLFLLFAIGNVYKVSTTPIITYTGKIVSVGHPDKYGDQNAMVFVEDKNIYKAHNIGNTGFYKIGSSITFEDKRGHIEQTFGFVLLAALSFVTGLFLIMFSPLIK